MRVRRGEHVGSRGATPAGVTLFELLVVLVLLSLVAGVVGLALRTAASPSSVSFATARVAAARDSAVRSGHPVTIAIPTVAGPRHATALPDGRVAADSALGLTFLTGAPRADTAP